MLNIAMKLVKQEASVRDEAIYNYSFCFVWAFKVSTRNTLHYYERDKGKKKIIKIFHKFIFCRNNRISIKSNDKLKEQFEIKTKIRTRLNSNKK